MTPQSNVRSVLLSALAILTCGEVASAAPIRASALLRPNAAQRHCLATRLVWIRQYH